jgi:hypothetical protein
MYKRNYRSSELKSRTPKVKNCLKNIAKQTIEFCKDPTQATYNVEPNELCDRVSIKKILNFLNSRFSKALKL